MVGELDDPAILAASERIAARGAARTAGVVLPGTGHMLSLEQPAVFADLLSQFLADVASGRFDGQPVDVPASTGPDSAGRTAE